MEYCTVHCKKAAAAQNCIRYYDFRTLMSVAYHDAICKCQ